MIVFIDNGCKKIHQAWVRRRSLRLWVTGALNNATKETTLNVKLKKTAMNDKLKKTALNTKLTKKTLNDKLKNTALNASMKKKKEKKRRL